MAIVKNKTAVEGFNNLQNGLADYYKGLENFMSKEQTCKSCYRGHLGIMTNEEKEKAGLDLDTTYYGCDECKHYEEADLSNCCNARLLLVGDKLLQCEACGANGVNK